MKRLILVLFAALAGPAPLFIPTHGAAATAYAQTPAAPAATAGQTDPATTAEAADMAAADASTEVPAAETDAAAPALLWDRANTAYINGDYRAAAETYEELLAQGLVSVKLCYNLANAYFKADRLGKAILFYRRALRLAPGNGDIRYNLSVAEARTKDNIERIPEFFLVAWLRSVRHTMGCTAWTILSLLFLTCALGFFLFFLLAQRLSWRKTGFYGTLVAAVLFVTATLFAAAERRGMLDRTSAVVMPASAAVKSSPDNSATDLFLLHEGTVVTITDRLDDWCEIVIDDGKKGWIKNRKIEIV